MGRVWKADSDTFLAVGNNCVGAFGLYPDEFLLSSFALASSIPRRLSVFTSIIEYQVFTDLPIMNKGLYSVIFMDFLVGKLTQY